MQLLGELVVGRDHRHLQRRLVDEVERVPTDGEYLDRPGIILADDVDVQDQMLEDPTVERPGDRVPKRAVLALALKRAGSPMSKVNQSPSSISSTIDRASSSEAAVARQFASTSLVARACAPIRRISAKPPLIAQLSGAARWSR